MTADPWVAMKAAETADRWVAKKVVQRVVLTVFAKAAPMVGKMVDRSVGQ